MTVPRMQRYLESCLNLLPLCYLDLLKQGIDGGRQIEFRALVNCKTLVSFKKLPGPCKVSEKAPIQFSHSKLYLVKETSPLIGYALCKLNIVHSANQE